MRHTLSILLAFTLNSAEGFAQDDNEGDDGTGECSDGLCGTPQESGGGDNNSSVIIQGADSGKTQQYGDDNDEDGVEDPEDNCPFTTNPDQLDDDGDKKGNSCDLCPNIWAPEQTDGDGDEIGDQCDDELDGDGFENHHDNCPSISNAGQLDTDKDGLGNACDEDDDGDGFADLFDVCPLVATKTNSIDSVQDLRACDTDLDQDFVLDVLDNCISVTNTDQADADEDGHGDACDGDVDGDGIPNTLDNCVVDANRDQLDGDRDGPGDACDAVFCYVVDKANPKDCLNPNAPFRVRTGPTVRVRTGEPAALRIFANLKNASIDYRWGILNSPDDSEAVPVNSVGTVKVSTPFEYRYPKGQVATFTPDEPGTYQLVLFGNLKAEEVNAYTSSATLTITAEGEPANDGCSTVGVNSSSNIMPLLLLGFLFLTRRATR